MIEGLRQSESQVLTCPSCGESVFVLPQSPLPAPDFASQAPRREPATRPKPRPTKPRRTSDEVERAPVESRRRAAPAEVPAADALPRRPFWTMPRLVFASAAVVVALSAWWQWRRAELGQLAERMQPEALRGLRALEEGHFDEARACLAVTVEAMDRLGEHPPEEARYRQLLSELEIVATLAPGPIEDLLAGGLENPERVSKQIQGMAVILDIVVEPEESGGWRLNYTPIVDEELIVLDAGDFELFRRLAPREKTRIIFGARLDRLVRTADGRWLLGLGSQSGVLLTERVIYERLGLNRDPDSAALREKQRTIALGGREESLANPDTAADRGRP